MKNRDKYNSIDEFKAAFNSYCRMRYLMVDDCKDKFGRVPPVVRCTLCQQFWLNSDTAEEDAELERTVKILSEEAERREAFEDKYPNLNVEDSDYFLKDEKEIDLLYLKDAAIKKLHKVGVRTIGDLLAFDQSKLAEVKGCGTVTRNYIATYIESLKRYREDQAKGK